MSDADFAHRSISKLTLARLLGCGEDDLLSREEVAAITGLSEGTLANIAKDGPAYYRSTTSKTGGSVWYPRGDVQAFVAHHRATIKSSYNGRIGQQDWTSIQDDVGRLPVHDVVSMIKGWKESELYRRAQSILHDPNPINGRERFVEECRLFGVGVKGGRLEALGAIAEGDGQPALRKAIFDSLDDQTDVIEKHLLALAASHGMAMSKHHPSFSVLSAMAEAAWRDVLEAEMRWRNLDYAGMPDRKPQTINDVRIADFYKT